MILNIITFAVCLLMLIVFRKLDQTNIKMAKLRRYSSRLFEEFKKLAETENRRYNDATIEMDILIKKATAMAKTINSSVQEIESKLQGLDIEKTNLKKVEEDIRVISQSAREVNKQIEFIAGAKEGFTELTHNISYMKESMKMLKNESNEIIQNFNNRLKEKSREITAEFNDGISKLKESIESKEDVIVDSSRQKLLDLTETFERALSEMDQRVTDTGEILLQNLKIRIDGVAKSVEGASNLQNQIEVLKTGISDLEGRIFSEIRERSSHVSNDIQKSIDTLYNKVSAVEASLNESKSKLIKSFEIEVDKVRNELDNLNIHAITKRDEIVQASRREAETVKKEIENFEARFLEFENRITKNSEQTGELINAQMQKAKEEFSAMEQRLSDIKAEILNYEDQNKVFTKTETMMRDVNDAIDRMNRMLQDSQKEAEHLDKFFSDVEYVKELTKEFDRELRTFQNKKDRLIDIETTIKALEEMGDAAMVKTGNFQEQFAKIDGVSSRIDALVESYSSLEARIRELHEYEDIIARNLDSVNKADILIQSVEGKLSSFQKVVDRSEKRVDKINQHLREVEENLLILKTRESDIKEIKDKFNEVDGLSDIMEARVRQIQAMFNKVEALRDEINTTDNRLQELFSETDKKMRQFADFIQAVDNNNPILKQVKGSPAKPKNVNDNVIRTVRELSNKGWSSDEISRKLMMDENAVRLIINTSSL
jgi:DNA repair exonuclease SbcCD ATPase subunit